MIDSLYFSTRLFAKGVLPKSKTGFNLLISFTYIFVGSIKSSPKLRFEDL